MTPLNNLANDRFLKGDPIADEELLDLLEFYTEMMVQLTYLGPMFHLANKEIIERRQRLESYARARELDIDTPF